MPKLKSFFGGSTKVPEEPPKKMSRNRGPSVVARLMGLDMLPSESCQASEKKALSEKRVPDSNTLVDITVSGKQLNGVTNSQGSRKSKSFDDGKRAFKSFDGDKVGSEEVTNSQRHKDDLKVRLAPPQEAAECLQSIQLEELNKQLLAKHMQVLEELNEAKQQYNNKQRRPKGLSDSSEFLDAVELLQANRPFFERFFQDAGAFQHVMKKNKSEPKEGKRANKMKVANKIPQYLSGQSSPRPLLRPPEVKTSKKNTDRDEGARVVMKLRTVEQQGRQEKPTKDIAKLIAKKIKESITKEVAKTFYSKVDSAVSPQKGSPVKTDDISTRKHLKPTVKTDKPENATKKNGEVNTKKREENSLRPTRLKQLTKASSEVLEDGFCSKTARVVKSQRALTESRKFDQSKTSPRLSMVDEPKSSQRLTDKKLDESKPSSPRIGSPRRAIVPLNDLPRFSLKQKSANPAVSEKKSKPKPKSKSFTKSLKEETYNEVFREPIVNDYVEPEQALTSVIELDNFSDQVTPTKSEDESGKESKFVTDNKSSPVSVLDFDDVEDIKDVTETSGEHEPLIPQTVDCEAVEVHDILEEVFPPEDEKLLGTEPYHEKPNICELDCPKGKEDDLIYLRKLINALTNDDGRIRTGFALDSTLFGTLEDDYSRLSGDQLLEDPLKLQSQAINRWLIFDFVNEELSWRGSCRRKSFLWRAEEALRELWSEICDGYSLQRGEQSVENQVNAELKRDRDWLEGNESAVGNICQQIEIAVFNHLVEEAMCDFVC